jgi:hypothetical protein
MRTYGDAQEPLTIAARAENRLARALRRIGITTGSEGSCASYADLDALGEPVIVLGPIAARTADHLARVIEAAGSLASAVGNSTPPDQAGEPV